MKKIAKVSVEEVSSLHEKLDREAETGGYHLNPDVQFAKELVRGLIENERRYGYQACPCRLAEGIKDEDLDIICPCDYRDADLVEFGTCYCALYVSEAVLKDKKQISSIPERRPAPDERKRIQLEEDKKANDSVSKRPTPLSLPVWRCTVCGYLCARGNPPEICPVCKVKRERFKRFL